MPAVESVEDEMARYYFNIENDGLSRDDEGTELANADKARVQGVIFAGEYLRDNPCLVWDGTRFRVEVRDEADTILLHVDVTANDPERKN